MRRIQAGAGQGVQGAEMLAKSGALEGRLALVEAKQGLQDASKQLASLEAQIEARQRDDAAQQETGCGQQHDGGRQLAHDQRAAQRLAQPTGDNRVTAATQRRLEIAAALKRRRDPAEDRRRNADGRGEQKGVEVDGGVAKPRQAVGHPRAHHRNTGERGE